MVYSEKQYLPLSGLQHILFCRRQCALIHVELSTFYFHGNLQAAELSIRGWALIQNFAPCNPTTVERHNGRSCPAEWLNKSRYHENWLQNLLASASMGGFRYPPPKSL